jgi:hypothetical protein
MSLRYDQCQSMLVVECGSRQPILHPADRTKPLLRRSKLEMAECLYRVDCSELTRYWTVKRRRVIYHRFALSAVVGD